MEELSDGEIVECWNGRVSCRIAESWISGVVEWWDDGVVATSNGYAYEQLMVSSTCPGVH